LAYTNKIEPASHAPTLSSGQYACVPFQDSPDEAKAEKEFWSAPLQVLWPENDLRPIIIHHYTWSIAQVYFG